MRNYVRVVANYDGYAGAISGVVSKPVQILGMGTPVEGGVSGEALEVVLYGADGGMAGRQELDKDDQRPLVRRPHPAQAALEPVTHFRP